MTYKLLPYLKFAPFYKEIVEEVIIQSSASKCHVITRDEEVAF